MSADRIYAAIDLKSFYASVECADRGLDPLTANLVVADLSRTEKTICLAVSPSLKSYGIPGRARLFEVISKVREINYDRRLKAPGKAFKGKSYINPDILANPCLELDYITAQPRMARYMDVSTEVFNTYCKYISPDDIHPYSIDEVFMDVTDYLAMYGMTAEELVRTMIKDVLSTTGITATAGIGTNLYLCKIAMDIEAKHMEADTNGVRIAFLDEAKYREKLWGHTPITDFWQIGHGYAAKLAKLQLYTMGDVARFSRKGSKLLYDTFGVNAELLIDHAWGRESVTMNDLKNYRPKNHSLSSGQVLKEAYSFDKALTVTLEMADNLALDLTRKGLVTNKINLTIGYDVSNLKNNNVYKGEITGDRYGRKTPKHGHGTADLKGYTSSVSKIMGGFKELFIKITDKELLIRRITLVAENVIKTEEIPTADSQQPTLFDNPEEFYFKEEYKQQQEEAEIRRQHAILDIKSKFGKNAILRGINLEEGATAIERNKQIGGHKG